MLFRSTADKGNSPRAWTASIAAAAETASISPVTNVPPVVTALKRNRGINAHWDRIKRLSRRMQPINKPASDGSVRHYWQTPGYTLTIWPFRNKGMRPLVPLPHLSAPLFSGKAGPVSFVRFPF